MLAHQAMRSAPRIRRRLHLCSALVFVVVAIATTIGKVDAFHTKQHLENSLQPVASLADVIAFVQESGWSADLGYLCKGLALPEADSKCLFRQISIHAKTAELDDRGFSVPIDEFSPLYAVIYHVSPLTGEFFLASKDGKLVKAIFRARGTDFQPMPEERASSAFNNELAFWKNNLATIRRDVSMSKSNSAPVPEPRQ